MTASVFKLLFDENYTNIRRNRGEQSDTFFYGGSQGKKKEEKVSKYWIIFIKFKVNIANKLFGYWELQYTLVILSD